MGVVIMVIYKITNKINGKVYVGQTTRDFEIRKQEHIDNAFMYNINTHIYCAMRKYGLENFDFDIICEAKNIEELNYLETKYIVQYDSVRNGYNMSYGGDNNVMFCKKTAEKHDAVMRSDEVRKKISQSMKKYRKEHPWTEEQKRKFAESKYGNKNFAGHHLTPEHREAINKKLRKKVHCIDENKNVIAKFNSVRDAAKWWWQNGYEDRKSWDDIQNIIKNSAVNNKYIRGLKWIYE